MAFANLVVLPTLGLLVGMLIALEVGRFLRRRFPPAETSSEDASATTIEAAVFALFGLLVAFAFSGAAGRFDDRRALILQEANAIGTAYLRVDLLPEETRPRAKALFRDYVRSRIETYRKIPDLAAVKAEYDHSVALQGELWSLTVPVAKAQPNPAVATLLVSALNDMFDLAYSRLVATRMHVPGPVIALLFGMSWLSALLVGYTGPADARRTWIRRALFAFSVATCIFVILDLEYPRLGILKLDAADLALEEVLAGMK